MKTRFSTLDVLCEVWELERTLVGLRLNQVYDIDNKTYLLRFAKPSSDADSGKVVLLVESGSRLHTTKFEWPKADAPSGFAMKLRKHLNNKRLESIGVVGVDRVVELVFGVGLAQHKLYIELFDKGNLVLADNENNILSLLRKRVKGEERFLVHHKYPVHTFKQSFITISNAIVDDVFKKAKSNESIKKVIGSHFELGPAALEHLLMKHDIVPQMKLKDVENLDKLKKTILDVFNETNTLVGAVKQGKEGFIIQKEEARVNVETGKEEMFVTNQEFHSLLFRQHEDKPHVRYESFNDAVDEFFSRVESQKQEVRVLQHEKAALKKLANVKKDHEQRVQQLQQQQALDKRRAELIEMNEELVEKALAIVRSAVASKLDWNEIEELLNDAKAGATEASSIAQRIQSLRLEANCFTLLLDDPYEHLDELSSSEDDDEEGKSDLRGSLAVELDLDLSAQANASRLFSQKKASAAKAAKTLESQSKALKSAERKTLSMLKETQTMSTIRQARKSFWFEKFYWFISSENFLVVAGRDAQQNELLVKKHLTKRDIYVHADLQGAASVIVKNVVSNDESDSKSESNSKVEPPPKTLNEAGQIAVCYSPAWDNKVIVSAWWVESWQVSKTAPSGEYLTQGSFMIRGKKNFLTPAQLVLGFGVLFKLEDGSVERHKNERRVRTLENEVSKQASVVEQDIKLEEKADENDNEREIDNDDKEGTNENDDEDEDESNENDSNDDKDNENDGDKVKDDDSEHLSEDESNSEIKEEPEEEDSTDKNASKEGKEAKTDNKSQSSVKEFPDTEVNVLSTLMRSSLSTEPSEEISFTMAASTKIKKQQGRKQRMKNLEKNLFYDTTQETLTPSSTAQEKRGKRSKMRKAKEKYKDQDEEERQLRMHLLQDAQKETKKRKAKQKRMEEKQQQIEQQKAAEQRRLERQQGKEQRIGKETKHSKGHKEGNVDSNKEENKREEEEEEEEVEESEVTNPTQILDSLTGMPVVEDELLFAVAVVGPYSCMSQYKFRTKVMPGTTKRGKATKQVLHMFGVIDKSASNRERELIKALKDQDVARNMPGKVKIGAGANLQKAAKKSNKKK